MALIKQYRRSILFTTICFTIIASTALANLPAWPTPSTAFYEHQPVETFIQPAASGKTISGLFGCVRNEGKKFHGGIDIKVTEWDSQRESKDSIFAALPGKVAYINATAGHSTYGKYVVLIHDNKALPIYTLYAHLKSIKPGLKVGQSVAAGSSLGIMGRTAAGYSIPKIRTHLHFEMGLQLSNTFDIWYKKQKFHSRNHHGSWNGINLIGFDPLDYYEKARAQGTTPQLDTYIKNLPTAFRLRVFTRKTPFFITQHINLLTEPIPEVVAAWEIDFTWFRLPKAWTPIALDDKKIGKEGDVTVLGYDPEELKKDSCRRSLEIKSNNQLTISKNLRKTLQIIFNF